ncbi:MAG: hypothetical protein IJV20_06535 [Prevotella sp.]|nr:hypothetical protein [Prevotella sp.]
MDVVHIENHHLLVRRVVEGPLLGLAVRRLFGSERKTRGWCYWVKDRE